jgi:polysaccharide pyruvyl transferase WcaK-like protein
MSWLEALTDRLRPAIDAARDAADPDLLLQATMAGFIARARATWPDQRMLDWRPGQPLRLLFAGYAGTRNTGADVRVEEMIRQFRHVLGPEQVDLSILTFDRKLSQGYFRAVKQIEMPLVFPRFLYDQVWDQHGVVACEGSMFKSKFSSALTTFMVGALGLANAGNKLSIAYGGEAGAMTPSLRRMVEAHCKDGLVICRNQASRDVLAELGVPSKLGTDTAWTFDPAPPEVGEAMLRAAGWDGVAPVLAVAPINPFWWPVKPDLQKAAARVALGLHDASHYRSIYFHHHDGEVDRRQDAYLDALAWAVRHWRRETGCFVVCVGMEQLDRAACEALSARLDGAPCFTSDRVEMFEMVSLLRQARWLVASRYHAVVTSMPGGVLSVGVTMDERIRNLMADRGTPDLAIEVEDPDLALRVLECLRRVTDDADAERARIGAAVVRNLEVMGRMGVMLAQHVAERLPGFRLPEGHGRGGDPWAHLPPMSPHLRDLVATHREARP